MKVPVLFCANIERQVLGVTRTKAIGNAVY